MTKENAILATALHQQLPKVGIDNLCNALAKEISKTWEIPITGLEISCMVDNWIRSARAAHADTVTR